MAGSDAADELRALSPAADGALAVNERIHPSLLANMRLALLAEFGARAIYPRLALRTRDAELREVLARFHQEECEQIETLRRMLVELGTTPPARSRRRSLYAWILAQLARARGLSLALRMCLDSEEKIARWYGDYANYLAQAGLLGHARTCEALCVTKQRHARTLRAWVAE